MEEVFGFCGCGAKHPVYSKDSLLTEQFTNVETMKSSKKLKPGMVVETLGYYEVNDGGSAKYIIRDKQEDDVEDNGSIHFIGNSLVAEMIIDNEINVKQFGAKGDGVQDETQIIKNAIALNKDIFVPTGTYLVNTPIEITTNVSMFGEGKITNWGVKPSSILKSGENNTEGVFECKWNSSINLKKIAFEGYGIEQPCSGFIDECSFSGVRGINNARVMTISKCIFVSCAEAGIKKLTDSKVLDSFIYNNEIGIYMYDSNDNMIMNNKIEWNNVGIKLDTHVFNLIQNNIFDRQTTHGIESVNGSNLTIQNNQFERNLVNHLKLSGMLMHIDGNRFAGKNSEDDQSGEVLPKKAIKIDSLSNSVIKNNIVCNSEKMFDSSYDYIDNNCVYDNHVNGKATDNFSLKLGTIELEASATGEVILSPAEDYVVGSIYSLRVIDGYAVSDNNVVNLDSYYINKQSDTIKAKITNPFISTKTFDVYLIVSTTGYTSY